MLLPSQAGAHQPGLLLMGPISPQSHGGQRLGAAAQAVDALGRVGAEHG